MCFSIDSLERLMAVTPGLGLVKTLIEVSGNADRVNRLANKIFSGLKLQKTDKIFFKANQPTDVLMAQSIPILGAIYLIIKWSSVSTPVPATSSASAPSASTPSLVETSFVTISPTSNAVQESPSPAPKTEEEVHEENASLFLNIFIDHVRDSQIIQSHLDSKTLIAELDKLKEVKDVGTLRRRDRVLSLLVAKLTVKEFTGLRDLTVGKIIVASHGLQLWGNQFDKFTTKIWTLDQCRSGFMDALDRESTLETAYKIILKAMSENHLSVEAGIEFLECILHYAWSKPKLSKVYDPSFFSKIQQTIKEFELFLWQTPNEVREREAFFDAFAGSELSDYSLEFQEKIRLEQVMIGGNFRQANELQIRRHEFEYVEMLFGCRKIELALSLLEKNNTSFNREIVSFYHDARRLRETLDENNLQDIEVALEKLCRGPGYVIALCVMWSWRRSRPDRMQMVSDLCDYTAQLYNKRSEKLEFRETVEFFDQYFSLKRRLADVEPPRLMFQGELRIIPAPGLVARRLAESKLSELFL